MDSIATIIRQIINSYFGRVVKIKIEGCRLESLNATNSFILIHTVSAENKFFEVSIPVSDWKIYDPSLVEIE